MNKNIIILAVAGCALSMTLQTQPALAQPSAWQNQVGALVKAKFSYPRSAIVRGEEGRAVIRVGVAADGNITNVTLSKSSGSQILDREAVRIAQKIGRVPAPPRGISSIEVPILWALD